MEEPRPHRPATPEELAAVDAALEKTKGNRAHAAMALGMEPRRIYNLVQNNPHLKAKWSAVLPTPPEPGPDTDLHRPPPLEPFSPTEVKVVDAITKAELKDGFNDEVPNTPWYISLLGSLLPFVIIGAIFWFLMGSAQGGNSRVMNFGKSRAKMVTKRTRRSPSPTLPVSTKPSKNYKKSKNF